MRSLSSLVNEVASDPKHNTDKNSILSLITKYLDAYEVEGGEHLGHGATARRSYLVKCTNINDVEDICKGIWSIIAEWQGIDKPEESCIKYMTAMWKAAFKANGKEAKFVRIPFEIYDKN